MNSQIDELPVFAFLRSSVRRHHRPDASPWDARCPNHRRYSAAQPVLYVGSYCVLVQPGGTLIVTRRVVRGNAIKTGKHEHYLLGGRIGAVAFLALETDRPAGEAGRVRRLIDLRPREL
jgi:hypothetical protein